MTDVPPGEPRRLRLWGGLAGFYATAFVALGVYMQFFPVWLRDERDLDKATLSVVLTAQTISRTLAGPLWAQFADRLGRPRAVLLGLAAASALVFCLFAVVHAPLWLWCVSFAFGCLYSPMHPILDALTMHTAQRAGFAYGRVRMVGSLAYLVSIVLVGWWLERTASAVVVWLLVAGLGATAAAGLGLPAVRTAPATERAPMLGLLRSGPFVLLLVASGLIQGSHATYYNLSTLHWTEHGIGKGAAGLLWAEGVLAEIVLFFWARSSVERLRPTTMMMLGGCGAIVRWCIVGSTTSVVVLAATNWLHALSFTCTYLGSLRALERRVPASHRATAQGLLGAANSGVGMVVCGLCGGFAYDRWGGFAFFLMAAFAAAGVGLALVLRRKADHAAAALTSSTTPSPE